MTALHRISVLLSAHLHESISVLVLLACLVFGWYRPQFGGAFFEALERAGAATAKRKGLAMVVLAAATILIRLSLLWAVPMPVPRVHDEFSYLLAADTFVHGRLTNPTHPMWEFFDTIHVNQHPTYMSKYPPAQGAVLAVGMLLGNPWFGVVLSVGLMSAAILWMLQGWLPPGWALLGGILVMFRLGIFTGWMNSYWGGAVAAIGGALVVGAMPRIMRLWRTRDALLLAFGAAILANSRPFEGLIFCLPVMVVLLVWLFSKRSPPWRVILPRIILPFCAVGVLCGLFMGYYNWRGTGSATLFPYVVNERTYFSAPTLIWEKIKPPIHYANPQLEAYYNVWSRTVWFESRVDSVSRAMGLMWSDLKSMADFFLWPELLVPLVALPWLLWDRRVRFLILQSGISLSGMLLVTWYQPHYTAPLTATLFALLAQAIRHMRRFRHGGRPVGIGLSRVVVLAVVFLSPHNLHIGPFAHRPLEPIDYRAMFERRLQQISGEHLVIVRYDPSLDKSGNGSEWVYNGADIDRSKVVWAREIPGKDIGPLLGYFHGRHVWLAEPDAVPPRITPYTGGPEP